MSTTLAMSTTPAVIAAIIFVCVVAIIGIGGIVALAVLMFRDLSLWPEKSLRNSERAKREREGRLSTEKRGAAHAQEASHMRKQRCDGKYVFLVSFLYELMRDYVPPGVVEGIVSRDAKCMPDPERASITMTNGHLGRYAMELAERLVRKEKEE